MCLDRYSYAAADLALKFDTGPVGKDGKALSFARIKRDLGARAAGEFDSEAFAVAATGRDRQRSLRRIAWALSGTESNGAREAGLASTSAIAAKKIEVNAAALAENALCFVLAKNAIAARIPAAASK